MVDKHKTNFCGFLWKCSWFFASNEITRPHWSGFMQRSTHSMVEVCTNTDVEFLSIVDMDPNDESCIFSTLHFILNQAKKLKLHTACITFDQPLWLKAIKIVKAEQMPVVVRLGGFHTLMSYLGSIGKIMKGSGLKELFEEAYAPSTVPHLISGHAIARSCRGHILAQSALSKYITLRENKTEFIKYLSQKFSEAAIDVVTCRDDADTEIVRLAVGRAKESAFPVVVATDDTDVAVMLLYHWQEGMRDILLL